jgi:DNA replication protein DnaC
VDRLRVRPDSHVVALSSRCSGVVDCKDQGARDVIRHPAPDVIATAASQRWEHAEVLRVLLAEEAAGRDQATISMRRKASGLPAGKTFDAWEPTASAIPAPTQNALRTLEWVDRHEVLVVCGPSALKALARAGLAVGSLTARCARRW